MSKSRMLSVMAAGTSAAAILVVVGALTHSQLKHKPSNPSPSTLPGAVTVVAVGDIFNPSNNTSANQTAKLIDQIDPQAILGLGDYQYETGSCDNFMASGHYDSVWGRENRRLYPVFGPTHDYNGAAANAAGYMSHDCPGQTAPVTAAGDLTWDKPYSYNVGSWHIIALPSLCFSYQPSCDPAQVTSWLEHDLSKNNTLCSIAYWHEPYWTSPTAEHDRTIAEKPWVQLLYKSGVELLLSGHQHMYERFNRQNLADQPDETRGIRQIIVGTGGMTLYHKTQTAPNEAAYNDTAFGVLKLQLAAGTYTWQFMPTGGSQYTDSGTGQCHQ
jgi:hypothetical protein